MRELGFQKAKNPIFPQIARLNAPHINIELVFRNYSKSFANGRLRVFRLMQLPQLLIIFLRRTKIAKLKS